MNKKSTYGGDSYETIKQFLLQYNEISTSYSKLYQTVLNTNISNIKFTNARNHTNTTITNMIEALSSEFEKTDSQNYSALMTSENMQRILNDVFQFCPKVEIDKTLLFNEKIIQNLTFDLQYKKMPVYLLFNHTQVLSDKDDIQDNTVFVFPYIESFNKLTTETNLKLFENKMDTTKIFNSKLSEDYSLFEERIIDYITVVHLIKIDRIKTVNRQLATYIQTNYVNVLKAEATTLSEENQELRNYLNKNFGESKAIKYFEDTKKKLLNLDVHKLYNFDERFAIKDYRVKEDIRKLVKEVNESNLNDLYKDIIGYISNNRKLNAYCKQSSASTSIIQVYSVKKKHIAKTDATSTKLKKKDFKFDQNKFESIFDCIVNDFNKKDTIIINIQNLEPFYYGILSVHFIKTNSPFLYKNQLLITNLRNIAHEQFEIIVNNRNRILSQYFKSFTQFVYRRDYRHLSLGAYLISLLIIPYLPFEFFVYTVATVFSMYKNKAIFKVDTFANKTDKEVLQRLKTYLSITSRFDHVLKSIENVMDRGEQIDVDTQEPFMLGFFTFLNESKTAGSCQDRALIDIMRDVKNDTLYGLELNSYPEITHWESIQKNYKTKPGCNIITETADGRVKGTRTGIVITHNKVILSNNIGTCSRKGVVPSNNCTVHSKTLVKADVAKIEKDNYQARANIFLALTLSHVFRHTKINNINDANGVAFQIINQSSSQIDSFEKAILYHIQYILQPLAPSTITRDADASLLKSTSKFNFDSIRDVFTRNIHQVLKNARETKRRNSTAGGKKNETYERFGKYNNRVIYKKRNAFYIKVKQNDKYIYKEIKT